MKSSTKKWFIAAGILILLGIILSAAMFAASGFRLSVFASNEDRVKNEYEIERSGAVNLDISTISSNIVLKESKSDVIKISCYESDKITFTASVDDNTIIIKEQDNRKWFEYLIPFIGIKDTPLVVELPTDGWENITLESTSGSVNADNFTCRKFAADTTSGDINTTGIISDEEILLDSISGDVVLKNSTSPKIHSQTTSGNVFVSNITDSEIEVSSTSGDVSVYNLSNISSLFAKAISGDIELENIAAEKIEAETISGDIEFENIDAENYRMASTSGDIEGKIVGDESSVSFFTDTTSGGISVPYGALGNKIFYAETVSGDIDIDFE